MIPYGRPWIDDDDRRAVLEVLESTWLTTGPVVDRFEAAMADAVGTREAVAVANGTAALHLLFLALDLAADDEVVVPAITFAATASTVLHAGGRVRVVDVNPETLLIDPGRLAEALSARTRAVIAVDYAGHPCDYAALRRELADRPDVALLADGCHALGGATPAGPVGSLADATTFSFHPVKPITTAEGGLVSTTRRDWAERIRLLRNHGIDTDARTRAAAGLWNYDIDRPGFNYRLSDLQCALGLAQLRKLDAFRAKRAELAQRYDNALRSVPHATPLGVREAVTHAWHLYVIRLAPGIDRDSVFAHLRAQGVGVNVHYPPVHGLRFVRDSPRCDADACPVADDAAARMLTLPLHVALSEEDIDRVVEALDAAIREVT